MTDTAYNTSEELGSLIQEVFDEYAIAILRFYVSYKTAGCFEEFLELCE